MFTQNSGRKKIRTIMLKKNFHMKEFIEVLRMRMSDTEW